MGKERTQTGGGSEFHTHPNIVETLSCVFVALSTFVNCFCELNVDCWKMCNLPYLMVKHWSNISIHLNMDGLFTNKFRTVHSIGTSDTSSMLRQKRSRYLLKAWGSTMLLLLPLAAKFPHGQGQTRSMTLPIHPPARIYILIHLHSCLV